MDRAEYVFYKLAQGKIPLWKGPYVHFDNVSDENKKNWDLNGAKHFLNFFYDIMAPTDNEPIDIRSSYNSTKKFYDLAKIKNPEYDNFIKNNNLEPEDWIKEDSPLFKEAMKSTEGYPRVLSKDKDGKTIFHVKNESKFPKNNVIRNNTTSQNFA